MSAMYEDYVSYSPSSYSSYSPSSYSENAPHLMNHYEDEHMKNINARFIKLLDEYEQIKHEPMDWETIRNGLLNELKKERRALKKEDFIEDEEIFI